MICPLDGTPMLPLVGQQVWECSARPAHKFTESLLLWLRGNPDVFRPSEPEPEQAVELMKEPVIAQRLWQLTRKDGNPFLLGQAGHLWQHGELTARCNKGRHKAPHWNPEMAKGYIVGGNICLCGVNAYKLTTLPDDLNWACGSINGLGVVGIVELGGEVHEYDRGYRAEHALIREATILTPWKLHQELLDELEDRYECSFRAISREDWETEWEATYGRDRETSTQDQGTQAGSTASTIAALNARAVQTAASPLWPATWTSAAASIPTHPTFGTSQSIGQAQRNLIAWAFDKGILTGDSEYFVGSKARASAAEMQDAEDQVYDYLITHPSVTWPTSKDKTWKDKTWLERMGYLFPFTALGVSRLAFLLAVGCWVISLIALAINAT